MANKTSLPDFDRLQGANSLPLIKKEVDFPESPFISSQPLRYNVQLNRQLTALQRAEGYLHTTERQVAQLQRALQQERAETEIKPLALKTLHWLQQRTAMSGNAVDRQLNFVPEQRTEVNFALHGAEQLLQPAESETLLFSLTGNGYNVVAVNLPAYASPAQNLLRLNNGLGRLGIHGRLDPQGNAQFHVDEKRWAEIEAHLQVRGGGGRFAKERFQPLKLQPEVVLEDRVRDIAAKPQEAKKHLAGIQQAMGQITGQMRKLSEHKRNTGVQINSMSSFSAPNSALMAAEALAEKLLQGRSQYAMWANMLTAQGNARSAMVRNLLGG
ncbi:flagellar hook-associated protein [Yersinia pseudotuberculosis]|uniref:Flagellar hook-associated protein n=1 Tax=Yersinia pseudotuberculosis TaxID=633 RepID=A0ABN5RCA7_YERPU|nr:flagellar hook-associated protein [Yersinia pseudotuberculosis]MBP0071787.1 flagellar hook-associated protein [Yersinia pseudotuberculosis]